MGITTKKSLFSLDSERIRLRRAEAAKNRDSISRVVKTANPPLSSNSSIDSPLTEQSRTTVDFEIFDDLNVWSVIEKHVTELVMTDANGNDIVFNFIDPNTP